MPIQTRQLQLAKFPSFLPFYLLLFYLKIRTAINLVAIAMSTSTLCNRLKEDNALNSLTTNIDLIAGLALKYHCKAFYHCLYNNSNNNNNNNAITTSLSI